MRELVGFILMIGAYSKNVAIEPMKPSRGNAFVITLRQFKNARHSRKRISLIHAHCRADFNVHELRKWSGFVLAIGPHWFSRKNWFVITSRHAKNYNIRKNELRAFMRTAVRSSRCTNYNNKLSSICDWCAFLGFGHPALSLSCALVRVFSRAATCINELNVFPRLMRIRRVRSYSISYIRAH